MSDTEPESSIPEEQQRTPLRFSLATLLGGMTAVAICCAIAVWSADSIVLPILAGAILFRGLFCSEPQRLSRFAISASVGGLVTLLACLAGWNSDVVHPLIIMHRPPSFLEFVLYTAPLNALRSYAASGTLAFFLSFHMLRPDVRKTDRSGQLVVNLVVLIIATAVFAALMGLHHFPIQEHH